MASTARTGFQTQKKSALVAQQIVNEIVGSAMTSGDRLPAEAEMGEHYGVGRSTIREALRQLESQGVIRIKTGPGGGPVVCDFDAGFLAANMALHLQLSGGTFRDVIDALVVIEPAIAGAAAERRCDETVAEFESVLGSIRDASDKDAIVTGAARFHDLLADAADNPFFVHLMQALHHISEPFARRLPYHGEQRDRLIADHNVIFAAIANGDRAQAAAATRDRLTTFIAYVEAEFPVLLGESIDWGRINGPSS